jgi:hypothetical protein
VCARDNELRKHKGGEMDKNLGKSLTTEHELACPICGEQVCVSTTAALLTAYAHAGEAGLSDTAAIEQAAKIVHEMHSQS